MLILIIGSMEIGHREETTLAGNAMDLRDESVTFGDLSFDIRIPIVEYPGPVFQISTKL